MQVNRSKIFLILDALRARADLEHFDGGHTLERWVEADLGGSTATIIYVESGKLLKYFKKLN